ncbi:hypothetical protein DRN85_00045 [Methanosarcinales archaeon]|nr:MAG: hypothetical protein DRN85_00045 [Methanosarcinales archaeon]RLG27601.1 MAG: hypothetical protein DRN70_01905 [Methanosarcinales archaeon]HHI30213.1 hypothetical protein [Candidatus Methanoperedenaceae archaeon]
MGLETDKIAMVSLALTIVVTLGAVLFLSMTIDPGRGVVVDSSEALGVFDIVLVYLVNFFITVGVILLTLLMIFMHIKSVKHERVL